MTDEEILKLSREEQETHINQSANERTEGVFEIYSDDPVWINKIEKLGIEAYAINAHGGKFFRLDDQFSISIRKRRKLTRKERDRLAKQLQLARAT